MLQYIFIATQKTPYKRQVKVAIYGRHLASDNMGGQKL